jgi:hypothetical protein
MAADFENYRRRVDKEREEFQSIGMQRAIEAVLPALDDLDRAKASFDNVSDPKAITESLRLVHSRFTRCLEQLGIKELSVIGKPFDPRMHEPVQEIPTNEMPEGSVLHELRKGYSIGEKILRPSLVNVATSAGASDAKKAKHDDSLKAESKPHDAREQNHAVTSDIPPMPELGARAKLVKKKEKSDGHKHHSPEHHDDSEKEPQNVYDISNDAEDNQDLLNKLGEAADE